MGHRNLRRYSMLVVFLVVLVSRLPFLGPGYGVDADGWRVVQTGQLFAQTGEYRYSRQPGYPLQEALGGLVAGHAYWVGNLVTAAMSALAALFFLLILRFYGVRDDLLAAVTLALTPVVYVESTGMMDYVNALACLLGATYATLTGRVAMAGLLLGLATGFRASSAAMFLPLAVYLLAAARQDGLGSGRFKQVAALAAISGGVALLLYAVPLATYGAGLFESYTKVQRPFLQATWIATVGVFGVPGALAVAAGLAQAAAGSRLRAGRNPSMAAPPGRDDLLLWLLAAAVPVMVYVWQPSEAGYLIPAVPFILLVLARYASRRVFVLVCAAVCASPFLGQFTPTVGHMVPSILANHSQRIGQMKQVEALWEYLEARPVSTAVIAAGYTPMLQLTQPAETGSRVRLTSWATAEDISAELSAGVQVLCFAEACRWNVARTGADPLQLGARAFPDG